MAEPVAAAAARLIAAVDRDPWGDVLPSVYETARVLSLAPWLEGSATRRSWLLDSQAGDGSWGEGPARYRLLPTLSAIEALLADALRAGSADGATSPGADRAARAVAGGLAALATLPAAGPWPDTAAHEILVPALVARINRHLDDPGCAARPGFAALARGPRAALPGGYHAAYPGLVADRVRAAGLPEKLHHTYEGVADLLPAGTAPATAHLLGSSPASAAAAAATAGEGAAGEQARSRAIARLAPVGERYGRLFPEAAPVTVFERLWVAAALARAGLAGDSLPVLRSWVAALYDRRGVRGAPGLMIDADDTAMAALAAALTGLDPDAHGPDALAVFARGDHYDCYLGEDTGSVTANAHAVQALDRHLTVNPAGPHAERFAARAAEVRDWLLTQQQADGSWPDKWHASPYYATARTVAALAPSTAPRHAAACARAARWVLDSQHNDGSWGVWGGTAEETAYAVQILLQTAPGVPGAAETALRRAEPVLRAAAEATDPPRHPALWHDKTLYAPQAMIQAEILAALHLLGSRPAEETSR